MNNIHIKKITKEDHLDNIICMKEITKEDYLNFIKEYDEIIFKDSIGKREIRIKLGEKKKIKKIQPKDFELEGTTIWSFPHRGDWATHQGNYRGNWAPQIPRNLILRYTKENDIVLDQMVGSGTTLIECKLLNRYGIGIDINPDAIMLTRDRLNFDYTTLNSTNTTQRTFVGDARNLNLIDDESIDLISTHPPYANIIPYSKNKPDGDLSYVYGIDEFIKEMEKVAKESYRVLKPDKYCAILIGDTRRNKHYVPIAYKTMEAFLNTGFLLKEDIIKHQWQCKATGFWKKQSIEKNFLLLMHEHLFVFRKPKEDEDLKKYKESMSNNYLLNNCYPIQDL